MRFEGQTAVAVLFIMFFSLLSVMEINKFKERDITTRNMFTVMIDQHGKFGQIMKVYQTAEEHQHKYKTGCDAVHRAKVMKQL